MARFWVSAEHVGVLADDAAKGTPNGVRGRLKVVEMLGPERLVYLDIAG